MLKTAEPGAKPVMAKRETLRIDGFGVSVGSGIGAAVGVGVGVGLADGSGVAVADGSGAGAGTGAGSGGGAGAVVGAGVGGEGITHGLGRTAEVRVADEIVAPPRL